jgi:hypothetical protein
MLPCVELCPVELLWELSCAVGLLSLSFSLLADGFLIGAGSEGAVLALLLWRAKVPLRLFLC